ncbi:hypothetical protein WMW72_16135 [Paenibacillus filicis]|uniref:Uncharacterized protein n=1 Tax=Paenibacillus filicis TaxID=669464 RepID=A0ABU9DKT0_9BACL
MSEQFYQELRQLSYEDEIRSRLLIDGVKQILEQKQQKKHFLYKMFHPKMQTKPVSWFRWNR